MLACAALAGCGNAPEDAAPRNVILVTIDTLRADHTSLAGDDVDTTPELERFARGGVRFTRAWSLASWTLPSMATILTGAERSSNDGSVRAVDVSIAELFAEAGYSTAGVVANGLMTPSLGYDRGFDAYAVRDVEQDEWTATEIVDRGIEHVVGRDPERPFFLFLHFFDPHHPYTPPDEFLEPPLDDPARLEAFRAALPAELRPTLDGPAYREIEDEIARYDGETRYVDRELGRFFAKLEELDLLDTTIVAITSDHGEGLWQRYLAPDEQRKSHDPFPDLYQSHGVQVYSEQTHVPLVFRGPGIAIDGVVDRPVAGADVAPTLLALAGLDPAPNTTGFALLGGGTPPPDDRDIFTTCSRVTAVTTEDRWRLHLPSPNRAKKFGREPEYYDLSNDPLELEPIRWDERAEELRDLVQEWRHRYRGPAPERAMDAAERARLEALGYSSEADR
ncbi:MAG: sulfatase [Planctomycetota bacterium]